MGLDNLGYIDDYYNGLLSEEQKRQLEQKIISDPAFAEEVAFYLSTRDLLRSELAEDKKQHFKTLYEQHKAAGSLVRPMKRQWTYAAAAAVLVLVAGLWWILARPSGPQRLADNYISQHLQTLGVNMSSKQDSLQNALNTYNAGQLPEALQQFQQLIQQDTANFTAKEYAGIVCLRLHAYDKALEYFRQLASYTSLYANPALFYQSLTLLKRNDPGDIQEAKQLLQQVVDKDQEGKEIALQWLKEL